MARSEALTQIIAALRARPIPQDSTWEDRRRAMESFQQGLTIPEDVTCEAAEADGVPVEWISTPGADESCVLFYLHGGGYTLGSIATHRHLMQRLSRAAQARVLAVDYRLAPEHPFPAAVEDSRRAWTWLLDQGIEAGRCAIAGDSAGGGLSFATLLDLKDRDLPVPAAAAVLSPWTDLTASGASVRGKADEDPMVTAEGLAQMADAYLAGESAAQPLASPLFGELADLPPVLIQVGTAEILLDDATRIAQRASAVGVEVTLQPWEDMIHVFQAFPMLEESEQAITAIGEFVQRHTR